MVSSSCGRRAERTTVLTRRLYGEGMLPLIPRVGACYEWGSHERESTRCYWTRSGRPARCWRATDSNVGGLSVSSSTEREPHTLVSAGEAIDSAGVKGLVEDDGHL